MMERKWEIAHFDRCAFLSALLDIVLGGGKSGELPTQVRFQTPFSPSLPWWGVESLLHRKIMFPWPKNLRFYRFWVLLTRRKKTPINHWRRVFQKRNPNDKIRSAKDESVGWDNGKRGGKGYDLDGWHLFVVNKNERTPCLEPPARIALGEAGKREH